MSEKYKQNLFKFRCWCVTYKEFKNKGSYVGQWDDFYMANLDDLFDMSDGDIRQQYTGIMDMYGKEIYEGDIVTVGEDGLMREVKIGGHEIHLGDDCCPGFGPNLGYDDSSYLYMRFIAGESIVVGNIFMNQDLLNSNTQQGKL